jgi:hypothetical protein
MRVRTSYNNPIGCLAFQEKDVDLLLIDSGDLHDGTWAAASTRFIIGFVLMHV